MGRILTKEVPPLHPLILTSSLRQDVLEGMNLRCIKRLCLIIVVCTNVYWADITTLILRFLHSVGNLEPPSVNLISLRKAPLYFII